MECSKQKMRPQRRQWCRRVKKEKSFWQVASSQQSEAMSGCSHNVSIIPTNQILNERDKHVKGAWMILSVNVGSEVGPLRLGPREIAAQATRLFNLSAFAIS